MLALSLPKPGWDRPHPGSIIRFAQQILSSVELTSSFKVEESQRQENHHITASNLSDTLTTEAVMSTSFNSLINGT